MKEKDPTKIREAYRSVLEVVIDKTCGWQKSGDDDKRVINKKAKQLLTTVNKTPLYEYTQDFMDHMSGEFVRLGVAGLQINEELKREQK